jgi:hypothetical protein
MSSRALAPQTLLLLLLLLLLTLMLLLRTEHLEALNPPCNKKHLRSQITEQVERVLRCCMHWHS